MLTEKILIELTQLNIRTNSSQEPVLSNSQRILFSNLLNLLERKISTYETLKFLKMFPKFRSYIQEIELDLRKTESISQNFFDVFDFWLNSSHTIKDCKNYLENNEYNYQEFCFFISSLKSLFLEHFQANQKKSFSNWINICSSFLKNIDKELNLKFKEVTKDFSNNFIYSYSITFGEFAGLCRNYIFNKYIMNFYCYNHNIILTTAKEVQLIDADSVIIASANTGNWDTVTDNDAWMSRQILNQFSKNSSIQNEEQMKCTFERFLQKKNIIITRSKMVRGEQQLPVKFLKKMIQGKKIVNAEWIKKIINYERIAQNSIKTKFVPPRPSINLRPQKFSATGIKLLHDNPYNFYAKYILELRELSKINKIKNMRGNFIHKVLEDFVKNATDKTDVQKLIHVSKNVLQKMHLNESDFGLWFFRLPRLLKFVTRNLDNDRKSFTEIEGKINFEISPEKYIYLSSKADRIDVNSCGAVSIIDYKTGTVPSLKEVKNFDASQLPIEGLIYLKNGFNIPIITNQKIESLSFWALNEPDRGGEIKIISNDYNEIEKLIESTIDELKKMLYAYNIDGIAYDYNPKYKFDKSYAHLARKKEWSDD